MTTYGILGPLVVTVDGSPATVTAGRDRVVLAMLLLNPDRVVSSADLVDAVWGDDPPPTARGQLQTCVSRLRRALPAGAVVTDPAGYRLRCEPGDLDATLFVRLAAEARARGDAGALRRALDLWRGPALAEFDSQPVRRQAVVLDERRAQAIEDWAELELAAGRERDLLGELAGLVERFPLRERLRAQLMVALYRSGRPADALAEYRRARDVLREELGMEPGRELAEVHRRILDGTGGRPAAPAGPPPALIRCLPRAVADFTGREAVMDRLTRVVERDDGTGPVVLAVDGMAGSGKTALALQVAWRAGDRYPDAHLFVDLRGHSERDPVTPGAALLILLRQLGVEAEQVPPELPGRMALWRSEVADRRVLLVLDDAAHSEQVADLLPPAGGCLAVITSRRRMTGLDNAHPESLPVFTTDEAVTLLARVAGPRVTGEPDEAAELVRRCGLLPLAVRLAGARLAHRPRWRVADLVRRLGEAALPELTAEDRSVAGALALSYGRLAPRTRDVLRLLGRRTEGDFDPVTVAALTGLAPGDARDTLDDLVDVHLVEEPEPGVYRLHVLVREFAAGPAGETGVQDRRGGADQLHGGAGGETMVG